MKAPEWLLPLGAGLVAGLGALALGAPLLAALGGAVTASAGAAAWAEHARRAALEARLAALAYDAAGPVVGIGAEAHLESLRQAVASLREIAAADRRRLRDVAARAFRAQENERLRIASELQEETAQTLAGLLIRLRVARGAADPQQRERILEELRAGLAGATDSVRRYARSLFPPALEDLGVVAAIEAYALALSDRTRPLITVAAEDVRGSLARDGELALYRAVQEALANAVRHAHARSIRVHITRCHGGVRATIQDDGIGFDEGLRASMNPCLGLLAMRERALFAGGSAEVTSTPGGGTRVAIEIPGIQRRPQAELPILAASGS